jgi:hypothetical protein
MGLQLVEHPAVKPDPSCAMLIDRFFVSHAAGRMNEIELRDFHTAVDAI